MKHLKAANGITYCGLDTDTCEVTRFHLLVTCGTCHSLERVYAHLGVKPEAWQIPFIVNTFKQGV